MNRRHVVGGAAVLLAASIPGAVGAQSPSPEWSFAYLEWTRVQVVVVSGPTPEPTLAPGYVPQPTTTEGELAQWIEICTDPLYWEEKRSKREIRMCIANHRERIANELIQDKDQGLTSDDPLFCEELLALVEAPSCEEAERMVEEGDVDPIDPAD